MGHLQRVVNSNYLHKKYRTKLISEITQNPEENICVDEVTLHHGDEEHPSMEVTVTLKEPR